jgi:riboflavin synthase alpha subunit
MFTGIIEEVGEVVDAHEGEITVRAEKVVRDRSRETASP